MLGILAFGSALFLQSASPDSGLLTRSDLRLSLAAVGATVAVAVFDERIARWTRQPAVQGSDARRELVGAVTIVNEMPLTVAALLTFGAGRLGRWETVSDVGWHVTESLLVTILSTEAIRVGLGRARPRASPDDAFDFAPGMGLTRFENRAFPSLHAAVAFTMAASLSQEIRIRKPSAARYATPLLYTAAMIPGLTRLYLDQHWASDVVAGTAIGAVIGSMVVRHSHGRQTKLDRVMLGMYASPNADGLRIGWRLKH